MPAPKRPNYFQSQFLVVRDFTDEQDYHRKMLQLHNQLMHDWGVVGDGLKVTGSGANLSIGNGSAIDSLGQLIVLETDTPIKIPAGQDVWITIAFQEIASTDPNDKYPPPGGSENVTRQIQSPLIEARTTAPPTDGTVVTLAKVTVKGDVDLSVRKQASGFVRTGSNDLYINGNVGIGTTAPKQKLEIRDGDGLIQMGRTAPTLVKGSDNGGAIYFGVDRTGGIDHPTAAIETSWGGGDSNPQIGIGVTREFLGRPGANLLMDFGGNANIRQGLTSRLFVQGGTGNVGIGTTNPEGQLQVGSGCNAIGVGPTPDTPSNFTLYNVDFGTSYLGFNAVRTAQGWRRSSDGGNNGGSIIYNRIMGELCFVTLETNSKEFFSDGEIKDRKRMVIDAAGNVSIAKDLNVTGALSVKGAVTLRVDANNNPDTNHGIAYFGAGAKDVGDFAFDGPVLYGNGGGALGTSQGKKVALRWDSGGNVGIGTTDPKQKLEIRDGDGLIQMGRTAPTLVKGSDNGGAIYFGVDRTGLIDRPTAAIETSWGGGDSNPQIGIGVTREFSGRPGANLLMDFSGNANIRQGLTSRLFVQGGTGNVGIGTTDPQAPLVVSNKGAKVSMLKLLNPNGLEGDLWWLGFDHGADSRDDNDRARVGVDILGGGAGRLFFTTGLAKQQQERMRIDENGNVGIGTTDPNVKLHVHGGADTAMVIGDRKTAGSVGLQFRGSGYKHAALRFDGDNVILEDASMSSLPSTWCNPNVLMNFIVRNGNLDVKGRILRQGQNFSFSGVANHNDKINVPWGTTADWNVFLSPNSMGRQEPGSESDNALIMLLCSVIDDTSTRWHVNAQYKYRNSNSMDGIWLPGVANYLIVPK